MVVKKFIYICLFGFMCFSMKLLFDWSQNDRYIIGTQGQIFDTRLGDYKQFPFKTPEQAARDAYEKNYQDGILIFVVSIAVLLGGIFSIYSIYGRSKERDLIERITAEYDTFESFKQNYPEWNNLSYKAKNRVKSFYKQIEM